MLCINKRLYWRDRAHRRDRADRSNRAHWRNRTDRRDRQRSSCGISERLLHTGPVRSQRFFADF